MPWLIGLRTNRHICYNDQPGRNDLICVVNSTKRPSKNNNKSSSVCVNCNDTCFDVVDFLPITIPQ
jgi:hypothetical protein